MGVENPVVGSGGPDLVGRVEIGLRDDRLVVMGDVVLVRFAPVGQTVLRDGIDREGLPLEDVALVFLVLDDAEDLLKGAEAKIKLALIKNHCDHFLV